MELTCNSINCHLVTFNVKAGVHQHIVSSISLNKNHFANFYVHIQYVLLQRLRNQLFYK